VHGAEITDAVRTVIESGWLAHLATVNEHWPPQVTSCGVGLDGATS